MSKTETGMVRLLSPATHEWKDVTAHDTLYKRELGNIRQVFLIAATRKRIRMHQFKKKKRMCHRRYRTCGVVVPTTKIRLTYTTRNLEKKKKNKKSREMGICVVLCKWSPIFVRHKAESLKRFFRRYF
jgi:FAD synthase